MEEHTSNHSDFGTGEKKLGMYVIGFVCCTILTLFSFWAVVAQRFSRSEVLAIIFVAAILQFFVQVVCFLRLSNKTEQGKMNIMTFLFTAVILVSILLGSLLIMWNLDYNMMN